MVALAVGSASAQNPVPSRAPAPAATNLATGFGSVSGTVMDSLHDVLLKGALVRIDQSMRESITD